MASLAAPRRLRRRPRARTWAIPWERRACRIGFVVGFVAGMLLVAALGRSDARGLVPEAIAAVPANSTGLRSER